MAKPSVLTVHVDSPCTASWEAMRGDDRVRHCLQCHLDVYDLSAMPGDEARAFVEENEGHACVRFVERADGTVLTQDCSALRNEPPRACVPRPETRPAPGAERGMAAKPRPPTMKMGKMVAPPPEAEPEVIDERLSRGTVLAELVRAVRASFEAEVAERYVRALDGMIAEPAGAKAASCPRAKCPLWIVEATPEPAAATGGDALDARLVLVEALSACVDAAFGAERAATLLRELRRHPFLGERGHCPHCRARMRAPGTDDW